jgi:hypothetical protein
MSDFEEAIGHVKDEAKVKWLALDLRVIPLGTYSHSYEATREYTS